MYNENETDFSRNYLREILDGITQPPCLMGGWAVYHLVNDGFKQVTGRDYLGSKDKPPVKRILVQLSQN